MKRTLICLVVLLYASNSWGILGIIKGIKKVLGDDITNIANQTKTTHTKVTGIESLVKDFKVDVGLQLGRMEANIQGQAGMGNKIENVSKDMRDDNKQFKSDMKLAISKVHNEMNNINKTITKTSIKQNQASIFYILALVLGLTNIAMMCLLGYFISKFFENRLARIKYEQEIDDIRKGRKV